MKVLVLTVNAFHLGYFGAYGNDWIETPALDRLAVDAVVFDNHLADQPDTAGAHRAWSSGFYHLPTEDLKVLPAPANDLLPLLQAGGVRTMLLRDERCAAEPAFLCGWDHARIASGLENVLEEAAEALNLLQTTTSWLLWVDVGTLMPPWQVPDELFRRYRDLRPTIEGEPERPVPLTNPPTGLTDRNDLQTYQRLQDSYAGAVTYLDMGVEQLWNELEERGLADEICVLVTSAQGLPLGEHGLVGVARPWLYDELAHTPLLLRLPGAAEATRRVLALTQSVDVLPTLLDLFGLPMGRRHGHSLLPLAQGKLAQVRPYAVSGLGVGERVEWALRTPDWSFILPVRQEVDDPPRFQQLYVRPDDRWEVNNLVQHHLALADHLEAVLHQFAKESRRLEPFDAPALQEVEFTPEAAAAEGPSPPE